MSSAKLSLAQRIASAVFLAGLIIVALKVFGGIELGIPKAVLISLMIAALVVRFAPRRARRASNG